MSSLSIHFDRKALCLTIGWIAIKVCLSKYQTNCMTAGNQGKHIVANLSWYEWFVTYKYECKKKLTIMSLWADEDYIYKIKILSPYDAIKPLYSC